MAGIFDGLQMLMGRPDPQQQLAAMLGQAPGQPGSPQGPQPLAGGPQAPPAAGGAPGGQGQQQQQAPPQPQAYQSPPDLAQAYMALMQRTQASNQFYNGLALLDAGMYPGRHPEAAQRWAAGMQQDPASLFQNLVQIQGYQQQQQALQAFERSLSDDAKLLGITQDQARALGPQGVAEAITKIAEANAGVTGDPTQKELAQARKEWHAQNPGKTDVDMFAADPSLRGPVDFVAGRTQQIQDKAAAGKDKLAASSSFHAIDPTLAATEGNVEWLNDPKHLAAVTKAINTPEMFTTDAFGNVSAAVGAATGIGGINDEVLQARSKLNWLKKQLYADRFVGTKNLRSNTEANNLGASVTNLDTRTNDQQAIKDELQRLQNQTYTARANLHAAAGKVVPGKYRGLADSVYLDRESLLYNGGKEAPEDAPPDSSGGSSSSSSGGDKPLSADELAQAKTLMGQHGREWVIKYLQSQHYKTDGL